MEPYFDILVGVGFCFPGPLQGPVYSLMARYHSESGGLTLPWKEGCRGGGGGMVGILGLAASPDWVPLNVGHCSSGSTSSRQSMKTLPISRWR